MPVPDHVWSRLQTVQSAIVRVEADALWALAVEVGDGRIVELGAWHGRSTCLLAFAARLGTPIHSVDPHTFGKGYNQSAFHPMDAQQYRAHLQRLKLWDRITYSRTTSHRAAREWEHGSSVRLLFVDGDHHLHATLQDWLDWSPLMRKDGIMAFHDRKLPGPAAAIIEACRHGWYVAGEHESLCVVRRIDAPTVRIEPR